MLAVAIAGLVFSPVVVWNATHGWASFAFQGDRAGGMRFRPGQSFVVLGGEALFVLPWIWLPMMVAFVAALRRGPEAWRSWLLCCLGAPPIVAFVAIAAWSSQRVLFHWAAPGYLMLFPLLGGWIAKRIEARWLRTGLLGTAVFVVGAVAVVSTQVRLDWLHPVIAAVAKQDPDIEAIDWTSLRTQLAARGLLAPGVVVGVPNWRDAGKIAYALGPDVVVTVLDPDARQFGLVHPLASFAGRDLLVIGPGDADRIRSQSASLFERLDVLTPATVVHDGTSMPVAVLIGHDLRVPAAQYGSYDGNRSPLNAHDYALNNPTDPEGPIVSRAITVVMTASLVGKYVA